MSEERPGCSADGYCEYRRCAGKCCECGARLARPAAGVLATVCTYEDGREPEIVITDKNGPGCGPLSIDEANAFLDQFKAAVVRAEGAK